jgi:hypothetical protein
MGQTLSWCLLCIGQQQKASKFFAICLILIFKVLSNKQQFPMVYSTKTICHFTKQAELSMTGTANSCGIIFSLLKD